VISIVQLLRIYLVLLPLTVPRVSPEATFVSQHRAQRLQVGFCMDTLGTQVSRACGYPRWVHIFSIEHLRRELWHLMLLYIIPSLGPWFIVGTVVGHSDPRMYVDMI
jgi:hypothetical protein